MIIQQTQYFPGDKVKNLQPHYTADKKLVKLNAEGRILSEENGGSLDIVWLIDEYPYTVVTRRGPATVDLK